MTNDSVETEPKRPQKGARKLEVDDQLWWWLTGRHMITLWLPNRSKIRVPITTVTGRSWDVFERGQHKRTSDGAITPEQVRQYVRTLAASPQRHG